MKRVLFIAVVFVCGITQLFSQTGDTIKMHEVFFGADFIKNEIRLSNPEVLRLMESNINAYEEMLSARNNYVMAAIFSSIGSGLIGFPLGVALGGGDPNWNVALVGTGLIAVSVPFVRSFKIKARNAVNMYNDGVDVAHFFNKAELNFFITGNGIGLSIIF